MLFGLGVIEVTVRHWGWFTALLYCRDEVFVVGWMTEPRPVPRILFPSHDWRSIVKQGFIVRKFWKFCWLIPHGLQ